jgi:poly-gamma-glutamate synthesis protein (capsule biosynthesis protein)
MKKYLFLIPILFFSTLSANQNYTNPFNTLSINKEIKKRMIEGNSFKKGCPVALKDLRYLSIKHLGYDGKDKIGELIVHKDISSNVLKIFDELYKIKYPIYKMELVSKYKGDDWVSIEANNTSAFNCRPITGTKNKWSKHAYGKAIDINPIENPYISKKGTISHKDSLKYRVRKHKTNTLQDKAILLKEDKAVKIFEKYGWKWGGDWYTIKDYQHFEYKRKNKEKI